MSGLIAATDPILGDRLSWFAFCAIVLCHSSQYPLMLQMVRDSDTLSLSSYSMVPALCQAITCSMWIAYGYTCLPTVQILANNSIGLINATIYVLCFVVKRPTFKEKLSVGILYVLACSTAILIYGLLYRAPYAQRDTVASALTTAVTIGLWVSPLVGLRLAALELDPTRVPIPLTACMLAATASWLAVGVYVGDATLVICSAFGVFCSLLQVGVIAFIYAYKGGKGGTEKGKDEKGVTILTPVEDKA